MEDESKPQTTNLQQNQEDKPHQTQKPQSLQEELEHAASELNNVQNKKDQEESEQESALKNITESKREEESLKTQYVTQSAGKNEGEQVKHSPPKQAEEDVKATVNIHAKTEPKQLPQSVKQPVKIQQVNQGKIAQQSTLIVSQDSSQKTQQTTLDISKQNPAITEAIVQAKPEEPTNSTKVIDQKQIPIERSPQKLEKQASKAKDHQANPRKRRKRVSKDKEKQEQNVRSLDQQKPKISSNDQIKLPTNSSQEPAQVIPSQQPQPLRTQQSVHSILEEYHSNHQEDTRIFSDTSFSKKKQNYSQLREWSKLRTEQTTLHLNTLDELQTQLQKALQSSISNFEMYSVFFRQRANQEEKYASHPIINTHLVTQQNDLSKNVYINCARLLNSLGDESIERCKKSHSLALFIRQRILVDHIDDHIKKTNLELINITEKISTTRQALVKCSADVDRKITKFAVRYNQYVTKLGYNPNKDSLKGQLSFLKKAFQQTQIQKKLGLLVFEYMKIVSDEEIKRVDIIKNCLRFYVEAMVVAYGITPDSNNLKQLDKEDEVNLIPQFYGVQDLLPDRFLEVLKKTMNIEGKDLSMTLLYDYLNNFKFLHFNSRILILKEYPIVYEQAKDKLHNGRLMISVDNYIHVFFDDDDTPYPKPSVSIKINQTLEIKSSRDLSVELKKKEEKRSVIGYLMRIPKTQHTFIIKFLKHDAMEQFKEFVIKLV